VEIVSVVLIWAGLLVALVLGALIAIGVIPLDRYIEEYQENKERERRSRESAWRATSGRK
jgi:hypothetical protein